MGNKPSVFDMLGPKRSFGLGIIVSFLLLFSLGFFVLLGIQLNKGNLLALGSSSVTGETASPAAPEVSPPPTPLPPGSGNIQLAAVTDKDWIRGKKDAKVTVVEFSDLECPFCKRFHPTIQQLLKEYPNDVRWVYRHFPLTSIHPKAPKEAEASECAGELGGNEAFWNYVDRLFEITPSNNNLDLSQLPQIAEDVGLNRGKFEKCLSSGTYAKKVQDHYNQAVAAGGRGTPYSIVVIGDQKIPVSGAVPYEQLKAIVDSVL